MTDKIFDDFMRDKLRNHSSSVPAGLWEKIEKENKRRPVGFFWSNRMLMMGLLLAIVATIGGLIWWQSNGNVQQTAIVSAEKGNIIHSAEKKPDQTSSNSNTQENTQTPSSKENPDNDVTVDAGSTIGSSNSINQSNNIGTSGKINNAVSQKGKASTKQSPNQQDDIGQTSTSTNQLMTAGKNKGKKLSVGLLDKERDTKVFIDPNNIGKENMFASSKPFNLGQTANINLRNANAFGNQPMPNLKKNLPVPVDCPSANGNARNDWYVEVYASPDYTFKTVKGGTASTAYLQKKDSTESMRLGYTVGARLTKNIGEHLLIKAGLQFSQVNERFILRTENERRTTTVTTTRDVVDASGNVTTVTETTSFTQIGYLERTSNNQYRSIELPIMLGYEFGNDKLKASINGGVITNLTSWYKGRTLDTAYQSISVNKSSDGVYSHNVGVSLYGSISIIKPIGEKLDAFAEPYFRYSLSNLNSSSLGYTQRFTTTGISFGLRYRFNYNPTKQHY